MTWHHLPINDHSIITQSNRACLIEIPNKTCERLSLGKGTKFWHPRNLVKHVDGGIHNTLTIHMPSDFTVQIFRTEGRNAREKIEQKKIKGIDIVKAWHFKKPARNYAG